MSRERHERLQELFLAAVDLPADRRAELLVRECGGDKELRLELEELLAADDSGVGEPGDDLRDLLERAGPYRILGEIGRGGMGVVYLAERSDGAFRRRVAIKVVARPGEADAELVDRFRSERQILAALDHPNIARLLDGGTLPDGSPYLVMEYVEGEPITEHARGRGLSVRARLELVAAVCDAVQAAHQSLVVHRDIKPGNVLVTGDGAPKLLDFGVAKILDPGRADWTVAETRFGQQPLTPRYASPEQLTGGPITTATDVYALGVLLYELLTGALPYRPPSSAVHHWIEAVCVSEPRRPSVAVQEDNDAEVEGAAGALAGDVDHIVLKALRKEPRNRYATAADLAADIRRHLGGLPIHARPATLRYRTGKFLRRHRWAAVATMAVVLVAGGFTLGLVRQLERTRFERDRAETVKNLLVQVFGAAGPGTVEGRDLSASELLDRGLEMVQSGLDDQPGVKAELLDSVARVYNNLGRLEEAAEAYEQALELRRAHRDDAPLEYAQSLGELAVVYLARSELERAEAAYREAWELTRAEAGNEDPRAVACLDGVHHALSRMGRHQEAEELARRVVDLTLHRLGYATAEAAVDSGSEAPELVPLATTLGSLAVEQRQLGLYDESERNLEHVLALDRRLFGEHHYTVAFTLNNLANVHSEQELYQEALAERGEALAVAEAVLGADHPSVTSMRLNQGIELERVGRLDDALQYTSGAWDAFTRALGPEHPATALAMGYTALVEAGQGDHDVARAHAGRALDLLVAAHGEHHPDVARSLVVLCRVCLLQGRLAEAVEHGLRAVGIFESTLGAEHPETLECRCWTAEPLLALGRYEEARELLEPALEGFEARGDLPRRTARARLLLERASR